jgi:hypothetical protein
VSRGGASPGSTQGWEAARIAAGSYQATVLGPTLKLLGDETATDVAGSATMRTHLTHILLVQVLRTLLTPGAPARGAARRLARRPQRSPGRDGTDAPA